MVSFAAAYGIVLFAIIGYVTRLSVAQRRMAHELKSLSAKQASLSEATEDLTRAA